MTPTCEADIERLRQAEEIAAERGCDEGTTCWDQCIENALEEVKA